MENRKLSKINRGILASLEFDEKQEKNKNRDEKKKGIIIVANKVSVKDSLISFFFHSSKVWWGMWKKNKKTAFIVYIFLENKIKIKIYNFCVLFTVTFYKKRIK